MHSRLRISLNERVREMAVNDLQYASITAAIRSSTCYEPVCYSPTPALLLTTSNLTLPSKVCGGVRHCDVVAVTLTGRALTEF